MVPLPRPLSYDSQSHQETAGATLLHHLSRKSAEHAPARRSLDPQLASGAGLYVFLGILITLCVAAPILAYLRKRKQKEVGEYVQRADRVTADFNKKAAELNSLQQRLDRLVREKEQSQTARETAENELREGEVECQQLRRQIQDAEQSMRVLTDDIIEARREKEEAMGREQDGLQLQQTRLETIESLEREVQIKESSLKMLQQKYDHVDQEYRSLLLNEESE